MEALAGLIEAAFEAIAARLSWPGGERHPYGPADPRVVRHEWSHPLRRLGRARR